jgi:hypothetical protein
LSQNGMSDSFPLAHCTYTIHSSPLLSLGMRTYVISRLRPAWDARLAKQQTQTTSKQPPATRTHTRTTSNTASKPQASPVQAQSLCSRRSLPLCAACVAWECAPNPETPHRKRDVRCTASTVTAAAANCIRRTPPLPNRTLSPGR